MSKKIKNCIVCGEGFTPTSNRQKTCSKECALVRKCQTDREKYHYEPAVKKPKNCFVCGKEFTPSHGGKKTCSDKCKRDYAKIQPSRLAELKHFEPMNCAYCGIEFHPKYPNQKCCCTKHGYLFYEASTVRKEARKLQHKRERAIRTEKEREARGQVECGICGKLFPPSHKHHEYCSSECSKEADRQARLLWHVEHSAIPTKRICKRCGEEFEAIGRKKYCRKHCSDSTQGQKRRQKVRAVIHIPYSKWEIFRRDDFICYICGFLIDMDAYWPMPYSSSIDHVIPIKRGGDDAPYNVKATHLICNLKKSARTSQ